MVLLTDFLSLKQWGYWKSINFHVNQWDGLRIITRVGTHLIVEVRVDGRLTSLHG